MASGCVAQSGWLSNTLFGLIMTCLSRISLLISFSNGFQRLIGPYPCGPSQSQKKPCCYPDSGLRSISFFAGSAEDAAIPAVPEKIPLINVRRFCAAKGKCEYLMINPPVGLE